MFISTKGARPHGSCRRHVRDQIRWKSSAQTRALSRRSVLVCRPQARPSACASACASEAGPSRGFACRSMPRGHSQRLSRLALRLRLNRVRPRSRAGTASIAHPAPEQLGLVHEAWGLLRAEPRKHLSVAADDEFREVPEDGVTDLLWLALPCRRRWQLGAAAELEDVVCVAAVYLDLGEDSSALDVENAALTDKLLDLLVRAGLLAPKLVAREKQRRKVAGAVFLCDLRQLLVVDGREASFGGHVGND